MHAVIRAVIGLLAVAGTAVAEGPPPVMLELGPVVPTPAPTPEEAERIRLITSFAVQNKPNGKSIISFEATDIAKSEAGTVRVLAAKQYSLVEVKGDLSGLRDEIVNKLRDIERDLLEFAERSGPPKMREPVGGPFALPGTGQ